MGRNRWKLARKGPLRGWPGGNRIMHGTLNHGQQDALVPSSPSLMVTAPYCSGCIQLFSKWWAISPGCGGDLRIALALCGRTHLRTFCAGAHVRTAGGSQSAADSETALQEGLRAGTRSSWMPRADTDCVSPMHGTAFPKCPAAAGGLAVSLHGPTFLPEGFSLAFSRGQNESFSSA